MITLWPPCNIVLIQYFYIQIFVLVLYQILSFVLFCTIECLRDAESYLSICIGPNTDERRRGRAARRLQAALVAAQEIGDEKLQVVQLLQDLIDNKQRSLDADHKKLSKLTILIDSL